MFQAMLDVEDRSGPWRLPRRDFIILPIIFVMTIVLLLVAGEIASRIMFVQDDFGEPCEYLTANGFRYHPDCTSHTKVWEGPWITQHFNACGYRSTNACGAVPAGSSRVVVVGSSTARGALVNYDDSFAARAAAALSKQCGKPVDFQNLGTEPADINRIDSRMNEVLGLSPSAIVMMIGTFDLVHLRDKPPVVKGEPPARAFNLQMVVSLLRDSRLFLLMQYYLYRDPSFQVHAFLLNADPADYVRTPLSAAWQARVDNFGDLLQRVKAKAGPVPVLLVYYPERAQAALARMKVDPPGIDPLVLGRALDKMAEGHGVKFLDATKAFATAPDFQSLFYLTDGHPKAGGHAALARVVEEGLLSEPAFSNCNELSAR